MCYVLHGPPLNATYRRRERVNEISCGHARLIKDGCASKIEGTRCARCERTKNYFDYGSRFSRPSDIVQRLNRDQHMQIDFEGIKKLIPQRFPLLMIDRVVELEPGKHIIALKNISGNDMTFLGHFPEKAIMPGALIIEAMAQAAIILFATNDESKGSVGKRLYYFGSVKARFLHPAVPGDQLKIKVVNVKTLPTGAFISGEVFVEDKKIAEAELVFSVKNDQEVQNGQ